MRKILLFLLVCIPLLTGARERDLETARNIAYDFIGSKVLTKSSGVSLSLVYDSFGTLSTRAAGHAPSLYVFDNDLGPGFVIVSGDDAVQQILAYSVNSNFRTDNMPPNLHWWLDTMNAQVQKVRENGAVATDAGILPGNEVYLCETAKWDQWGPFNYQCPVMMYKGKLENTLTGCGPTAIAIALRYREYPPCGTGTTPEYVTNKNNLTVPARDLSEEYHWEDMPLTSPYNSQWTDSQNDAVARLIADIGAAAQVQYDMEGTTIFSTAVPSAMMEFFGYDRSVYLQERKYYKDKDWFPLIRNEIRTNGPVIYSGNAPDVGHMFVLDGYDSNDYFHVNWGWSGSSDGYYSLSAMNPGNPGAGAGSLAHINGYNTSQSAILNFMPDKGGQPVLRVEFYNIDNEYGTFKGLRVKEYDQLTGLPSLINVGAIRNRSEITCHDLKVRLVVVDREMNERKILWEQTIEELKSYDYIYYPDVALSDYGTVDFGYLLMAQYYHPQEGQWKTILADRSLRGAESILLADEYTIEESTVFKYENASQTVTLTTKDGVEVRLSGNGLDVPVESVKKNTFVIETGSLEAGLYTVTLSKGSEKKDLRIVTGTRD